MPFALPMSIAPLVPSNAMRWSILCSVAYSYGVGVDNAKDRQSRRPTAGHVRLRARSPVARDSGANQAVTSVIDEQVDTALFFIKFIDNVYYIV